LIVGCHWLAATNWLFIFASEKFQKAKKKLGKTKKSEKEDGGSDFEEMEDGYEDSKEMDYSETSSSGKLVGCVRLQEL
jgi:hypothetical protein